MELHKLFRAKKLESFEEIFIFVCYHFLLGRYGLMPIEGTFAVELQALTGNFVF